MKMPNVALLLTAPLIFSLTCAADAVNNPIRGVGFGAATTGGNSGTIYTVTNLKDDGSAGSLRYLLSHAKRPALIKFSQCGTIELKSRLMIDNGDLTVDGSSCQNGAGIQFKNFPVQLHNVHNVILSNLAFRLGTDAPVSKGTASSSDSLEIACSQDIVLDHLSIYWGTDENLSFYCYKENGGMPVTRVSLQHSIVAEALRNPPILVGEDHTSKGVLIDGAVNDVSFYGNLFVSNGDRNPTIGPSALTPDGIGKTRIQFVNNMIYNTIYAMRSAHGSTPSKEWRIEIDVIGNLQKASKDKFSPLTDEKSLYLQSTENPASATVYLSNNNTIRKDSKEPPMSPTLQVLGGKSNFDNPIKGVVDGNQLEYASSSLLNVIAPVVEQPIDTLEAYIAATAGKILPCRDPIDRRVVDNVIGDVPASKGGQRPVDVPSDVGGYMINNWGCNP